MQKLSRIKRHKKIRRKIFWTNERPRLVVFRSGKHIYAQVIDDSLGKTVAFVTDIDLSGTKKEKSYNVGKIMAEKLLKIKIKAVVFDRGGFRYQGRIAELARGAREGGVKF